MISGQTTADILNDVALENLNNPNEEILGGAIEYLTTYGRPEDRPPIIQRFMKWTPAWKNYRNDFLKALTAHRPTRPTT